MNETEKFDELYLEYRNAFNRSAALLREIARTSDQANRGALRKELKASDAEQREARKKMEDLFGHD